MATKVSKDEVKKFVKENLVRANNNRIECGDGRYTPEQSDGAIRAFGGDFGMVMAIAASLKDEGVSLNSDQVVTRYLNAVKKVRGVDTKLYHHTDTHNHASGEIGCGHAAKASSPENDGMYGSITHEDVRDLYKSFAQNPESNLTVLEGSHQEKAVLFVHGGQDDTDIHYSVNSMDRSGNMYFVVDMDRITKFIEKVVPVFSEGLETPVSEKDVKNNFLKQMQATASILASDLDQYRIALNDKGHLVMEQLPKRPQASQ